MKKTAILPALACWLSTAVVLAADPARISLHIDAQPVRAALKQLSDQSGLQVLMRVDNISIDSVTSAKLSGTLTVKEAMEQLLANTGLKYEFVTESAVRIISAAENPRGEATSLEGVRATSDARIRLMQVAGPDRQTASSSEEEGQGEDAKEQTVGESQEEEDPERSGIPEILVTGSAIKSLNMDIKRTVDDAQPYVIFDRDLIERSAAVNLEDFLKNRLTMGANADSASQAAALIGNNSQINLRGLGADETLILVDGHRVAGINFEGNALQADLNGIPLAAVERIEVLPTTASGIYGGGATGGVINVVLRRDYAGLDAKLTYGNTFESDAATRRVDVSSGFDLEGGKTNILLTGSYSDANPLLTQERDLVQRGREHILANNPAAFYEAFFPPLGATSNIRSLTGEPLALKSGQSLNSPITFVPEGYGGTSTDGGAALLANAGQYNLDLANTAQGNDGARQALLNSPTVKSFMMTVRRQFSSNLQVFFEFDTYTNSGVFSRNQATVLAFIPASAPNNPFQQEIVVTAPAVGVDSKMRSEAQSDRALGGIIYRFSPNWQAEIDLTWNRSRFSYEVPGGVTVETETGINSGAVDVLRDLNIVPVDLGPLGTPILLSPADTLLKDATLRLAGSLPLTLPAGSPSISALLEHREEIFEDAFYEDTTGAYLIPNRKQSVESAYVEARVPIVAPYNRISAINLLELQIAARVDDYQVAGATSRVSVSDVANVTRFKSRQFSVDPTLGLKYRPLRDLLLRASYGTGYLPPSVGQLVPGQTATTVASFLTDPLRGNERLGLVTFVFGGSPDLEPEQSESWSVGAVLTPENLQGLRVAADWTKIDKMDNIISPRTTSQSGLNDLISFAPDRVTRAMPSAGEAVGPITSIDGTLLNIARMEVESLDLAIGYQHDTNRYGVVDLSVAATHLMNLRTQLTPGAPVIENAGVSSALATQFGQGGGLRWKATSTIGWQFGQYTLAWTTRFFDSYFLNSDHSIDVNQGSATVPSQTYHDLVGMYRFTPSSESLLGAVAGVEVRFGINNVLNKTPPVDVATNITSGYYSAWGDPRLSTYYLSVRTSFGGK